MLSKTLHDDLMILVNNAQQRQGDYRALARQAIEKAKGHPDYPASIYEGRQAAESILADALKDRFEWMTEDINPLPTKRFPKSPDRGPKGREDDRHEERKVMIACLVADAMSRVDWLAMAKDLLDDIEEIDGHAG